MLSVIDQHWREHLFEMDYLREGINLRAMAAGPLAEWQREGFDMFEAMMESIKDDFVRYIFRLEVVADDAPRRPAKNLQYSAPEDPVQGSGSFSAAAAAARSRSSAVRRRPRSSRRPGRRRRCRWRSCPAQRALLLRERQEVQAVPRALNADPRATPAADTTRSRSGASGTTTLGASERRSHQDA